jgi:hypothetical protein
LKEFVGLSAFFPERGTRHVEELGTKTVRSRTNPYIIVNVNFGSSDV